MAAEPGPSVPFVTLESAGVVLICGRDEIAVEAGNLLKDHLDVTVLIEPPAAIAPPRMTDFPVTKGKVRNASGYLGAFLKFFGVFAMTQVPLAIAEGFLTVVVMNALSSKTHVLEELGLVREQMS